MNFITIENFDESKLSVGGIYSATKPIQYQKIPLYYEYPFGKGPVILRTPVLSSLGVFENNSLGTNELTGYSMSFLIISPSFQSIMGEDLDLVEMESDDEM